MADQDSNSQAAKPTILEVARRGFEPPVAVDDDDPALSHMPVGYNLRDIKSSKPQESKPASVAPRTATPSAPKPALSQPAKSPLARATTKHAEKTFKSRSDDFKRFTTYLSNEVLLQLYAIALATKKRPGDLAAELIEEGIARRQK